MKIVIATDSFKGSVYAPDASRAMAGGIRRVLPDADIDIVPVADGGDGTLETLVEISDGRIETSEVTGPIGARVSAQWGAMGDGLTAVIEMARTSGLSLLSADEYDPLSATTYGLGEVISQALDAGFRRFILAIGGSATNDAGAGMAQALGARLLDEDGADLPPGGAALARLGRIDMSGLDPRISDAHFDVACDVNNPMTGPEGASAVYGPQKGATPVMVELLDAALVHFARVIERDVGADVNDVPGAGAAGGLGGGIMAFLGGRLRPGTDIVLDTVDLESHMDGANLVITGEGCMDFQTIYNKAPVGVARIAMEHGIPVIGLSGSLGDGFRHVHEHGIAAATAITREPMTLDEASERAPELIADAAEQAIRLMMTGSAVFSKSGHGR